MFDLSKIKFAIQGVTPLMFSNTRLANPLDPIVKEMKKISAKRQKMTDKDRLDLFDYMWMGGLYTDSQKRVVVPGEWIEAMLAKAAGRKKRDVQAGLYCEGPFPLIYDGPQTYDELYADERFRDIRLACPQAGKGRIPVCRPIFHSWSLKFEVNYNPNVISASDIYEFMVAGGQFQSIGAYRPRHGKFLVTTPAECPKTKSGLSNGSETPSKKREKQLA